jgi:hypothetical protein
METEHRDGSDVPAWLLDTDYNGRCFHVCQAEDSVWDHLAGRRSEPSRPGSTAGWR